MTCHKGVPSKMPAKAWHSYIDNTGYRHIDMISASLARCLEHGLF